MKEVCEIDAKIKKIKVNMSESNWESKYADKLFKTLQPYASMYRKSDFEYGLLPEYYHGHPDNVPMPELSISLEEAAERMSQHPFLLWLNRQSGFARAKEKIANEHLVFIGATENEVIRKHRNSFALEYVCSLLIHYFTNNSNKLSQIVVTKKKRDPILKAMKKLRHELKKGGGIYFADESKQHLLQHILDDELNRVDEKNVFSSEKNHPFVLRHFLTKKIIQCLFEIYGMQYVSCNLAADIALDITSIFFPRPMDRSDAVEEAWEILKSVAKDNEFKQKTIANILAAEGRRLMIF
jgi:hypothetical protein